MTDTNKKYGYFSNLRFMLSHHWHGHKSYLFIQLAPARSGTVLYEKMKKPFHKDSSS